MVTSTPAKGLTTTPKTPSILITPLVDEIKFDSSSLSRTSSDIKKRKTIFDSSFVKKSKKKAFVSTTPRTPTPLRSGKKEISSVCTETKLATIDEISKILMKKANTTSTPDHDYATKTTSSDLNSAIGGGGNASFGNELAGVSSTCGAGTSKTSLRRTLFETPCQTSMVRPLGVNLFTESKFTEKELNAIEQMSTCFTPQKEKMAASSLSSSIADIKDEIVDEKNAVNDTLHTVTRPEISTRLSGLGVMGVASEKAGGGFSFILNPQQQHKMTLFQQQQQQQQQQQRQLPQSSMIGLNQISGRPEIRILPLVGKPMKLPIRRLPPRNLNFSNNKSSNLRVKKTPTQGDAFRAVAFGQSHDQKFLTEQARLIMKEIHQASLI